MSSIIRNMYFLSLIMAFAWPRYMYINIAGKGVSPYIFSMAVLVFLVFLGLLAVPRKMSALLIGIRFSPFVIISLFAYAAIRLLADLNGISPGTSLMGTMQYILVQMAWVMVGMTCLIDATTRKLFPFAILVAGLLATAAGITEYIAQQPIAVVTGMMAMLADSGNMLTAINAASSDDTLFRIKGLFSHPIIYGQVMALLAPIAWHIIRFEKGMLRLGGIALLFGVAFGLYTCEARSPVIVLACCTAVYLALYLFDWRNSLRMAGFIFFLTFILFMSGFAIERTKDSVNGTNDREIKSSQARERQFFRASAALPQRPILGYGSGMSTVYAGIQGRNNVMTVDSTIIVEEIDGGYARLIAYAAMVCLLIVSGASLTINERLPKRRSLNAAVASWCAGIPTGLLIIAIDDAMSFFYISAGFIISGHALRAMDLD